MTSNEGPAVWSNLTSAGIHWSKTNFEQYNKEEGLKNPCSTIQSKPQDGQPAKIPAQNWHCAANECSIQQKLVACEAADYDRELQGEWRLGLKGQHWESTLHNVM